MSYYYEKYQNPRLSRGADRNEPRNMRPPHRGFREFAKHQWKKLKFAVQKSFDTSNVKPKHEKNHNPNSNRHSKGKQAKKTNTVCQMTKNHSKSPRVHKKHRTSKRS